MRHAGRAHARRWTASARLRCLTRTLIPADSLPLKGSTRVHIITTFTARSQVLAAVLFPFTRNGQPSEDDQKSFCAAQLAVDHVNTKNGSVVAELASTGAHGIRLRVRPFDTLGQADHGVEAATTAITQHSAYAVIGAHYSRVSVPVAARLNGMPQISPISLTDELSVRLSTEWTRP